MRARTVGRWCYETGLPWATGLALTLGAGVLMARADAPGIELVVLGLVAGLVLNGARLSGVPGDPQAGAPR